MQGQPPPPRRCTRRRILKAFLVIVMLSCGVLTMAIPAAREGYLLALEWCAQNSFLGAFIYALIFAVGAPLCFPMTLLAAASGYAFPYWLAVLATWLGGVLGAAVVYLVAHRLLRRTVEESCVNRSLFLRRLVLYVRSKGWQGVLLMRLPYIPFVTMNYVLSIGGISFKHYLLATAAGILPGSALFTYVGHSIKDIAAVVNGTEALSPIVVATTAGSSTLLTGLFIAMVVVVRRRMVAHADMMDERAGERADWRVDVDGGGQHRGEGGGGRVFAHGGGGGEEGEGFGERPGRSSISPLPYISTNIPSQMYPSMSKVDFVAADKGDDEYREFIDPEAIKDKSIELLVDLLRKHRGRVVFFTGAGIGTAAGLPDFRSGLGSATGMPAGKWCKDATVKQVTNNLSRSRSFAHALIRTRAL